MNTMHRPPSSSGGRLLTPTRIAVVGGVALMLVVVWATAGSSSSATTGTGTTTRLAARGAPVSAHDRDEIQAIVAKALQQQTQQLMQAQNIQNKVYPAVKKVPVHERHRVLVTGGAGFVGSHLVDRLMLQGHEVYVLDNLFTGRRQNIQHWLGHPNFAFFQNDVTEPFFIEVDRIYHLACPASPPHYQYNPIKTIKTSTMGTLNMLGLAKRVRARLLFTSTSEVYGDPNQHPQKESYWGNVNMNGPRACYDEGKRVAETMCYSYRTEQNVEVRVARIFNTFGPRMHPNDGRVVSNFIIQTLKNQDVTVYGDGLQTRSFQYVSDLVDGLMRLMESDYVHPVNIGNPDEITIKDFGVKIKGLIPDSTSTIVHKPPTRDDPKKRRPDISLAKDVLNWEPKVQVNDGLMKTIQYFREELGMTDGPRTVLWT